VEGALEVHVEHALPLRVGHLATVDGFHPPALEIMMSTSAELRKRRVHDMLDLPRVADIRLERDAAVIEIFDRRCVSARSPGEFISYGTPFDLEVDVADHDVGASRANVTACDRPCPRPPPVITATFPSSLPIANLPPCADARALSPGPEIASY
jgi:hypothetical protein